jgi:hypothetical protein
MHFLRLLLPLFAAALLLTAPSVYSVSVVSTAQKERSAHSKKPAEVLYVCPMHDNVTYKKPGTCPKCKMTLVKKPIVKEPAAVN